MIGWAILGTGFISNTVVEAIQASDGSRVVAVGGRNPETLANFAASHSIDNTYLDHHEAINDPQVDAVYIGLPNHKHREFTDFASAAGKAVLSEKSLTTTMEDAHALVDSVRANGTFFVEGLMYLAHPLFQTVTKLLGDGRLGELRSVSGRYAAPIAAVVNPAGMGTLYNLGCYPVSLLHLVLQTMSGDGAFVDRRLTAVGTIGADDTVEDAAVSVRFSNGVLATLQSSDNYGNGSDFAISTDQGVLRFETNPWLPAAGSNVLTWTPFDGEAGRIDPERIDIVSEHDAFYHQIKMVERHLAAADTEADRPSPRLADSLEIMQFLTDWEAAVRSS